MKEKGKRLLYLDLIRTIAVICVFVVHFSRQCDYDGVLCNQYRILPDYIFGVYLGSYGVSLFFIVSGASLMYVYRERFKIGEYLKKRFWGIYPMFWIAFAIVLLLRFYINREFVFECPKWAIIYTILGIDGYVNWLTPTFYMVGEWFLGCIILIYLLFPILRIGVLKKPKLTAILALAVYVFGGIFFQSAMPTDALFILRVPEVLVGMYFITYFHEVKPVVAAIAAGFLAVCAFLNPSWIPTIWIAPVVGVASFLVITFLSKFIECKLVNGISFTIGKYCYAIFLSHHIIIKVIMSRFQGYPRELRKSEVWLLLIVCACVTAVVSVLLFNLNKKVCDSLKGLLRKDEPTKVTGNEKK